MKAFLVVSLQIFLSGLTLFCQQSSSSTIIKERQEKLDIILRMQDTRTIYDGKLVSLLSDRDSIVQERAIYAYGSIQDTSAINLLLDRLPDETAIFALGQTAMQLSPKGKETLQHDLIWNRMTEPNDRLIEEIGKFGTLTALNDMILRFKDIHPPGLVLSIARFAIRGIVTPEGVQYLFDNLLSSKNPKWQTLYTLQRIGDHPESRARLEEVKLLFKDDNPLVRMNLAALFGKVRDERICLEPLQKMAEFDLDWRVRVNALKALGNYNLQGHDDLVTVFRRSFISENMNVALTAITAFGKSNLRKGSGSHAVDDAISTLESFVVNSDNRYQWQLQAAAAVAIAQLEQKNAIALLHPERYSHVPLQSELLNACAITGAKRALDILLQYTMDENPILRRSALDGLMELYQHNRGDSTMFHRTYEAALHGLKEQDVAIVTSAASLLGDSLFLNRSSVEPLTDALSGLRLPDDVEVIQQVIATLEALHDPRAVGALKPWLESRERSIASVAAAALKSITGQDYSSSIPVYAEPLYTDFDFFYLHALPETVKVKMETIRGAVVMELYKNYAPFTVMSFLKLATQRGFYRGLSFHRVVPNFVVQSGDPRGDGWGGPGYAIRSEFSPLRYETGSVGMASSGKDTEGSQFFITHSPQPHLDGRYTIFGKVISGMDVVDKIQVDDHILDIEELKE